MASMRHMMRHPSRVIEDASDEIADYAHYMAKRPGSTVGLVMLVLGVLGFIWLFPELHRYIRMERM